MIVGSGPGHVFEIRITPRIQHGWLRQDNMLVVPENNRFFLSTSEMEHAPFLASPESLKDLFLRTANRLVVTSNGAGIDVTDRSAEKTASFADRVDAAAWLHETYGMDAGQARKVLDSKQSLVLSKTAFESGQPMQAVPQQMPVQMPTQGSMEMPVQGYDSPVFDPSVMEQLAEIEDPELLDTGILATFAQNPDIKVLLVDYLPDFISAQDRLGRIILMLAYQKKELQDFFGSEKHTTLLSSCRKVFNVIGDLVTSLKQYVNMV